MLKTYSNKPYEPNMISRNIIYMISHRATSPAALLYSAARYNKGVKRPAIYNLTYLPQKFHIAWQTMCVGLYDIIKDKNTLSHTATDIIL